MKGYISIAQYADIKGVEVAQAFKDFSITDIIKKDGVTYVPYAEAVPESETKEEVVVEAEAEAQDNITISYLKAQIEALQAQIAEKDKIIADFTQKFADIAVSSNIIAEKALQTTNQAQILQAMEKKPNFIRRLFGRTKDDTNALQE